VSCAAAGALEVVLMIISTDVFAVILLGPPGRQHRPNGRLPRADIVGSSARANNAGAGCSAQHAGRFIPAEGHAFSRDGA